MNRVTTEFMNVHESKNTCSGVCVAETGHGVALTRHPLFLSFAIKVENRGERQGPVSCLIAAVINEAFRGTANPRGPKSILHL